MTEALACGLLVCCLSKSFEMGRGEVKARKAGIPAKDYQSIDRSSAPE